MDRDLFIQIENYMITCMHDSAHDKQHIYRVLYAALDLAEGQTVEHDVLIAASLLHDIGRDAQYKDNSADHALIGARMACDFLTGIGWPSQSAGHVKDCIETHRYRSSHPPVSIEAKILFDADKLDSSGTLGIARTILYNGIESQPLFIVDDDGCVSVGGIDGQPSFFREYHWKLKNIYDKFYTSKARSIAKERQKASVSFYENMVNEVSGVYQTGQELLRAAIR